MKKPAALAVGFFLIARGSPIFSATDLVEIENSLEYALDCEFS